MFVKLIFIKVFKVFKYIFIKYNNNYYSNLPNITEQHCNVENWFLPLKPIKEYFIKNESLNNTCIIFLIVSAKVLHEQRDKVLIYKKIIK